MERPSDEITFSLTVVKSAASNQEYTLTLIVQGFFVLFLKSHYYLYVTRNSCAIED